MAGELLERALVLHGGRVITLWEDLPAATSIALLDGQVLAVGDDLHRALPRARHVHLAGGTVVPGFHDAHNHMAGYGQSLGELRLSAPPMRTVDDVYDAVAQAAARQEPGTWIVGQGYDQNKLGGRHPTREELDRVAGAHRVWLKHTSGHMCVVNSRVLDELDLDAVPEGGEVVRDGDGRPTGLLREQAQLLLRPLTYPAGLDELVTAVGRAAQRYAEQGITACQEAGLGGGWIGRTPIEVAVYQEALERGVLPVRVTVMPAAETLHEIAGAGFGLDLGIRSRLGDDRLRLGPVKVFADGSLIGRTAAMFDDFADDPGNHGYLQHPVEWLRTVITEAHAAGWQVATHAIGDRAVATVLDIYEQALAARPRADARHRIEHCGVTRPQDVTRIARLGVVPVPQGRFVNEIGDGMRAALGEERTAWAYRQRSFLDAGIVVPGSSDRPVVDGTPLKGIADLVLQRTSTGEPFAPQEALSPVEALHAYTVGSAYAVHREHRQGRLAPGMLADLAVLGDDLTTVDPERIADIEVLATLVGGAAVHDGPGLFG